MVLSPMAKKRERPLSRCAGGAVDVWTLVIAFTLSGHSHARMPPTNDEAEGDAKEEGEVAGAMHDLRILELAARSSVSGHRRVVARIASEVSQHRALR